MQNPLQQIWSFIMLIVGMVVFAILFLVGIFIFSYFLIFCALVGLVLLLGAFIRTKLSQRRKPSPPSGRVIDHDDKN